MDYAMALNLISATSPKPNASSAAGTVVKHDLDGQCLRILRCTAKAMVGSPGGLRFRAGARPWLEGLSGGRPNLVGMPGRRRNSVAGLGTD